MRVFWWQGGVHLESESDKECIALEVLMQNLPLVSSLIENLKFTDPLEESMTGEVPVLQGSDEESVVGVEESSEVVS